MIYKIGDEIKIRPFSWFEYNCNQKERVLGDMINLMSSYCGRKAIITDTLNLNSEIDIYKLDIDNGEWSWQDYMFNSSYYVTNKLSYYCNNNCKFTNCDKLCVIYNYKSNPLNIGDTVTIRSLEWFNHNERYERVGTFNKEMSAYCGHIATITEIFTGSIDNINLYKLNIDNEKWNWQDYMFEDNIESHIFNLSSKVCSLQCINYCNKSCKLYNYSKLK